jgi:hypothetical protein
MIVSAPDTASRFTKISNSKAASAKHNRVAEMAQDLVRDVADGVESYCCAIS